MLLETPLESYCLKIFPQNYVLHEAFFTSIDHSRSSLLSREFTDWRSKNTSIPIMARERCSDISSFTVMQWVFEAFNADFIFFVAKIFLRLINSLSEG